VKDLVKPGRYKARLIDHGVSKTKAGDPQAVARFEFETSAGYREMTWFGSFKEGAIEHTLRALVTMGLKGSNPAGALEIGREVSIVISVDKDEKGVERNRINWVNSLGGIQNKVDQREASAMLERYSGAVMALKERDGVPVEKKAAGDDERFPWDQG
jgi:hypothetical protein